MLYTLLTNVIWSSLDCNKFHDWMISCDRVDCINCFDWMILCAMED